MSFSEELLAKFGESPNAPPKPKEAFVVLEREFEYNGEYYNPVGAEPVAVFFDHKLAKRYASDKNALAETFEDYDGDSQDVFVVHTAPVR